MSSNIEYRQMQVKTELPKTTDNKVVTITDYLKSDNMLKQFQSALGSKELAERFVRIILTSVQTNQDLQKCTLGSIITASLVSAQLHLEPNTPLGHAWLIPYFDSKSKQYYAQFQLGYKGLLDLFYRHPLAKICVVNEVRYQDVFAIYEGNRLEIYHKFDYRLPLEKRGDVIGYYCIAELTNGARNVHYAHIEDIMAHAKRYSQSFDKPYSPWKRFPAQMCMKTVAKACLAYMPLSVEIREALANDEKIRANVIDNIDVFDLPVIELDENIQKQGKTPDKEPAPIEEIIEPEPEEEG
ncbi:MAG: recombinase RecT [Candidatus Cloacimonas acidaminovorans]|nr:recombinase RecT [Candidatus Cloacimonas acidaminovorans]